MNKKLQNILGFGFVINMGNLGLYNILTDLLSIFMQKHNEIPQLKTKLIKPSLNKNRSQNCNIDLSLPKNVKKQRSQPLTFPTKADTKQENVDNIMNKLLSMAIQKLDFDEAWSEFNKIVGNHFKLKIIFLEPINQLGEQLMKQGSFLVLWIKIVAKNPFIVMPMVAKTVRNSYLPHTNNKKQQLESYLSQIMKDQQNKTPSNPNRNEEPLKRPILKIFHKKVQFGKDEIVYPAPNSSHSLNQPKLPFAKEQMKQQIRKKQGFLLDYFQINEITLLIEVEVIGVIKQFDETYAIILVKDKESGEEKTCIALTAKDIITHSLKTLQDINKQFENLAYLELNGKSTSEIWVDSLPCEGQMIRKF